MTHFDAQNASDRFPQALEEVVRDESRIVIEKDGKEVAALIPIDDLHTLEALEDRIDNELADRALAEIRASGDKPLPLNDSLREIGREDLIRMG